MKYFTKLIKILKLIFAVFIGGFLGIKIAYPSLENGNSLLFIFFIILCYIIGYIIANIGNKKEP